MSGSSNPKGHYCHACHIEKVKEWHQAALEEEKSNITKLKIVYGKYWQHYASPEEFFTTLRDERDFCPYCGISFNKVTPNKFNEAPYHLDHMDPLDKGGEHSIRNVIFCCGPCNIKKRKQSFLNWLEKLKPKYRELSRNIYTKKHGHQPEEFVEGCNMGRGSQDMEFATGQTVEELKKQFPKPKVDRPPSNQPLVIELDIMEAIKNLPEELKEKLRRKN